VKLIGLLGRKSGKKRRLAKPVASSNLYADDYKDLRGICQAEGATVAEVLREVVSDWFRIKRLRVLSQDEMEPHVRQIYERTLEKHLRPLTETVKQLKTKLDGATSTVSPQLNLLPPLTANAAAPAADLSAVMERLDGIRTLVQETRRSLGEIGAEQIAQISQLQIGQLTLHAISNETFSFGWTLVDLIMRYLVEVQIREFSESPDDLDHEIHIETTGLRIEALNKLAEVEKYLQLPEDMRLTQFLAGDKSYPMNMNRSQAEITPIKTKD